MTDFALTSPVVGDAMLKDDFDALLEATVNVYEHLTVQHEVSEPGPVPYLRHSATARYYGGGTATASTTDSVDTALATSVNLALVTVTVRPVGSSNNFAFRWFSSAIFTTPDQYGSANAAAVNHGVAENGTYSSSAPAAPYVRFYVSAGTVRLDFTAGAANLDYRWTVQILMP